MIYTHTFPLAHDVDVLGVVGEGVGVAAVRRPEVDGHHYTWYRTLKLKVIRKKSDQAEKNG